MTKMKVATIGLVFDSKKDLNELSLNLPKDTEILSTSVQTQNNENTLWICYMSPSSEFFSISSKGRWQELYIVIVKCNYTEVEIDNHKYIGTIAVGNDTYTVFYKKVAT